MKFNNQEYKQTKIGKPYQKILTPKIVNEDWFKNGLILCPACEQAFITTYPDSKSCGWCLARWDNSGKIITKPSLRCPMCTANFVREFNKGLKCFYCKSEWELDGANTSDNGRELP